MLGPASLNMTFTDSAVSHNRAQKFSDFAQGLARKLTLESASFLSTISGAGSANTRHSAAMMYFRLGLALRISIPSCEVSNYRGNSKQHLHV
jgi:hypothetical protein